MSLRIKAKACHYFEEGGNYLINIDELINRKPNRWGNLSIKEFERDIKVLQETCQSLKRYQENTAKSRLQNIIDNQEKQIEELISIALWSIRRIPTKEWKRLALADLEKVIGHEHQYSKFIKQDLDELKFKGD